MGGTNTAAHHHWEEADVKANFSGVTTAHTQTESRSEWRKRDEARKREIERSKADKQLSSIIMECMESQIARMRKPQGLQVVIEPWEAHYILAEGGTVHATVGLCREQCWLDKDGNMWCGMIPARLANIEEFETEIRIFREDE